MGRVLTNISLLRNADNNDNTTIINAIIDLIDFLNKSIFMNIIRGLYTFTTESRKFFI